MAARAARDAIQSSRVLCFDLEEDGPYRDICIAYLKNRSLTSVEQASVGDGLSLTVSDGKIFATVKQKERYSDGR